MRWNLIQPLKKGGNSAIFNNTDGPGGHLLSEMRQTQENEYSCSQLYKESKIIKLIVTAKGKGKGKRGNGVVLVHLHYAR